MSLIGSVRPGGRTARTAATVYAAALTELTERPYGDITVESIAARAGVHRTTVYRRWGSADEVVSLALQGAAEVEVQVRDTGTLADDLLAMVTSVAGLITSPTGGAVLRTLIAAAPGNPRLRAVADRFWQQRLLALDAVVRRAVGRGELAPGTDTAALMRAAVAPVYHAVLVAGEVPDDRLISCSVEGALAAARAGVFASDTAPPHAGGRAVTDADR